MSRRPRSSFAAPLVVTLAVAPACGGGSSPAASAPPPERPVVNPPEPVPVAVPPDAAPEPVEPAPRQASWTVYANADGSGCTAYVDVHCPPPPSTCNPPPPQKLASCPGATAQTAVKVRELTPGDCYVVHDAPACPPDVACNPPRPIKVDCPSW